MDLGTIIVIGGMISVSLWIIIVSINRIIEVWLFYESIGAALWSTVGWLILGGIFAIFLYEAYGDYKESC